MVGEKLGDTEWQPLKNVEHNQLSVKLFSNADPGTDTILNYNRCSIEFWMWLLLFHLPTAMGWGRNQQLQEGAPRASTEARN